jgi:hypothetical protein
MLCEEHTSEWDKIRETKGNELWDIFISEKLEKEKVQFT